MYLSHQSYPALTLSIIISPAIDVLILSHSIITGDGQCQDRAPLLARREDRLSRKDLAVSREMIAAEAVEHDGVLLLAPAHRSDVVREDGDEGVSPMDHVPCRI